MNMKKRAEHTYGLSIAVIAACAMLPVGFGAQASAASDDRRAAAGLEATAHPASAEQPVPNPPAEIGPVTPPSSEPEAKSPIWVRANRLLLILVFVAGIVIVGMVAVKVMRNRRKP